LSRRRYVSFCNAWICCSSPRTLALAVKDAWCSSINVYSFRLIRAVNWRITSFWIRILFSICWRDKRSSWRTVWLWRIYQWNKIFIFVSIINSKQNLQH
jgi:hypothetical protein